MPNRLDRTRAEQAVLYVCYKMQGEATFGGTVLNKILYYIDHTSYIETGKTITGFGYVKQVNGPTPKPAEFLSVKAKLLKTELRETEASYFGRLQKRLIPIMPHQPNMTCFTGDQVALMDSVIDQFKGVNAKTASDVSHEELSWQVAGQMEELPPFVYLLSESDLDNDDIAWAQEIIQGHQKSLGSTASTQR